MDQSIGTPAAAVAKAYVAPVEGTGSGAISTRRSSSKIEVTRYGCDDEVINEREVVCGRELVPGVSVR